TCSTTIANAASAALATPSLTVMRTPLQVPASPAPGVPHKRPVPPSKLAHEGLFAIVKSSVSPSGSLAVGRKSYGRATRPDDGGLPLITGARFAGGAALTVMVKAGRAAVALPSSTLITIP